MNSFPRISLLAFGFTLAFLSCEVRSQAAPEMARVIAELGLQEAPTPVRDRPGWRRPKVVIVQGVTDGELQALRAVAPGVELVAANDMAAAMAAAPRAEAALGLCSAELLARGPNIRWIQLRTAGVERCVTIPAVAERNILVTNMQRVTAPMIAEHVMAMALTLARGLPMYLRLQDQAKWQPSEPAGAGMSTLQGKTMLIAGLGGIGTEVARRAHAFDMRLVATDASKRRHPDFVSHVGQPSELLSLIRQADVIVNTLPLTKETTGVFDAKAFVAMKPRALFINVGRGGTVVTSELVKALVSKRLGGAGLDVTDPEPLPADHPLWRAPNVVITPHVAAMTETGNERIGQVVRENLRRYVAGERMLSVVDVKRGY